MRRTYRNCLAAANPKLAAEWCYHKNQGLTPTDVTTGSHKKVWWVCARGHSWRTTVKDRFRGRGCPYCSGRKASTETSIAFIKPLLASEWHPTKNLGLTPADVTKGCNKKVWWQCGTRHEWEECVFNRFRGSGCPYCAGKRALPETCLAAADPQLARQWHPAKNKGVSPADITPGSDFNAWWFCEQGHEWRTAVERRTRGDGCPYCSGHRVCQDNSLAASNPGLAVEWHPTKNGALAPNTVTKSSSKKAWWRCSEGHDWEAIINDRSRGTGCPYCSGGPISRISQEWLDSLGIPEEFREYPIKLPGRKRAIKVDGFDPKTNTVYEFLGDFWHGNPDLYDSEDVNPVNRKTYGALHRRTMRRLSSLERSGYSVVFIWEKDFKSDRSI